MLFSRGELVNKQRCCSIFGWTRQIFDKQVREGMPVASRPDDKGGEYKLYTGEIVSWLVNRAAAQTGGPGGKLDPNANGEKLDPEAELARLRKEQADKAELDNERLRKELVARPPLEAALAGMDASLKDRLMMVPTSAAPEALTAGETAGSPGIAEVYRRHIGQALSDVAAAKLVSTIDN